MSQIWYRPPGTRDPIGASFIGPLWYRDQNGVIQVCGMSDPLWRRSWGFYGQPAAFSAFGYFPVTRVGDTVSGDPDLQMDIGL